MIKSILTQNEQTAPNAREMEILRRHFPRCFTKEGTFDIDLFKSQIQDKVNITHEGYDLNFLGKNYAKLLSSMDTTTVIQPDEEHNALPENANSQNIYISGDNLDGLKHLLKSYAGAVKCIYIDPPYNTGTDGFVYNDRFTFTAEELSAKLSIGEEQAAKILDLTRRGSASHSAWLTFMACRLQLARDLLTDDGVIFISIDDNEQANLKLLCDSIFGEENYVSNIVWKGKGGGADNKYLMQSFEFVLMCAKNKDSFVIGEEKKENEVFPKFDEVKKRKYKTQLARKWGANSKRSDRPNLYFSVTAPDGREVFPMLSATEEGCWRWGQKKMNEEIRNGNVEFVLNENEEWVVYQKIYEPLEGEYNTRKYSNILEDVGNTAQGTKEVKELFGGNKLFDFPKPVSLIFRLVQIAALKDDDIIIDFFSGSATTAQAVMQLNAEDGGSRRYIMVQLPEETPENSEARWAGYNTIDQIGQERIRRATAKIKAETGADIDYGFKHYTLAEPDANTLDQLENFDPNAIFADETVLEKFGKSTILETWLVRDGYGFGASANEVKLDNYTAYHYDKHLYLIDVEFTEKDLAKLIDRYNADAAFCPENIVIFGYSFTFTQTEMLRKNTIVLRDGDKNLKINIDVRY
jgi:adenine specific DNA methylase Mod